MIVMTSTGALLTSDALDECDVVSMLDGSVSCCIMLSGSLYKTHVMEKVTDCYGSLELYHVTPSMLPSAVPTLFSSINLGMV